MGSVLGDNLRALRDMHGLTQQELADIAQVSRETVNKWESGVISSIRTTNIETLRKHFHLCVDDLQSETRGLAAQRRRNTQFDGPDATHVLRKENNAVPLVDLQALYSNLSSETTSASRGAEGTLPRVPVPEFIWQEHPHAFAIEMNSSVMSRVLPKGSHAIIDPTRPPSSNSLVLAAILCEHRSLKRVQHIVIRRLQQGNTAALLSTDSYDAPEEDLVVPTSQLNILGTVIWYQSAHELI